MRFVEATHNNETSIRLVGDRQDIHTLQEFVTSCALGALESATTKESENIKGMLDRLYDLQAITADFLPTFAKVIDDGNHFVRRDIILESVRKGRLGLAEYARERRVQAIPVHDLFLTSEGLTGFLHKAADMESKETNPEIRIKPYFWDCDAFLGNEGNAIARAIGATCYGYRYEIVPEGLGYNLLTNREHIALGTQAESGDFVPLVTILHKSHPASAQSVI